MLRICGASLVAVAMSGCSEPTGPPPAAGVSYEKPEYAPLPNPGAQPLNVPEILVQAESSQPAEVPELTLDLRALAALDGVVVHPDSRVRGGTAILDVFYVRGGKEMIVASATAQLSGAEGRLPYHVEFDHGKLRKGSYRWRLRLSSTRPGQDPATVTELWTKTVAEGTLKKP